jgi:hypothetical protein
MIMAPFPTSKLALPSPIYLIMIYLMSIAHIIKQWKAGQRMNAKMGNKAEVVRNFKVLYKLLILGEWGKPQRN